MSDIIFARTRWNYDSYSDFWRLVELSGFPIIYLDEIPREGWRDKTVIATPANGEWKDGILTDARVIHWQLEWQIDPTNGSPPGVAEVWASDPAYAQQIGARYIVLGSHPGLGADRRLVHKTYDVVMLQYLTPRRQRIRHELLQVGVSIAPDGWGEQRSESLMHSRLMLHVHQHDHIATIAPLRWAIAAAYKLPVVSELISADSALLPPYIGALYSDLVSMVRGCARADTSHFGAALYEYLCVENTFRACVERAV